MGSQIQLYCLELNYNSVQVSRCFGILLLYFSLDQLLFQLTRKFREELGNTVIQVLPVDIFMFCLDLMSYVKHDGKKKQCLGAQSNEF